MLSPLAGPRRVDPAEINKHALGRTVQRVHGVFIPGDQQAIQPSQRIGLPPGHRIVEHGRGVTGVQPVFLTIALYTHVRKSLPRQTLPESILFV